MVEEFFAWVKQQVSDCTVPPKSKTGQGLNFVINQEKYLRVFLEDGDIPQYCKRSLCQRNGI
jgi:hypothetical protein